MIYYACSLNLARFHPILYLLEGSEHPTLINNHLVYIHNEIHVVVDVCHLGDQAPLRV